MKLVAPPWYFWSSIWSWLHYFNSSVNTFMIKKREKDTREGKKTQKKKFCSQKKIKPGKTVAMRAEWVQEFSGNHTWQRGQSCCPGQDQTTTPANIWQWIKLSFKWKTKYSWSQLELGQVLSLVIEYGKWFGAAVNVDEEKEHVIQAL